ncbi:MAG TPA: TonB-dependent receptor [Vicinamibacterales bacterium]
MRTIPVRSLALLVSFLLSTPSLRAQSAQDAIAGIVVDANGSPVVRALVTIADAQGKTVASTFTDRDGRFDARARPASGCSVEATLSGFVPARLPCARYQDMRLSLAIAPLHEAVVVTATRGEAPGGQLAASVTVFERDDIERRQTPLVADLLRHAPGVTVMHTGAYGTQTSLFVRGGESNYNKVLLDGIPLNEPGGVFYFNNLTSEHLERVELVRGSHSALFGSDAMASVVQMFTRRATRDGVGADGTFEAGGYGTVRASAGVRGKRGAVDYSFHGARYMTDNRVPNNEFDNTTLSASAGIELAPGTTLRFVGRGEFGDVGTPGQTMFGRPDLDARFERHDGVAGVTLVQRLSHDVQHRATYGFAASNQTSVNSIADPPYTPTFEGHAAPFEFGDFPYDLRNELTRHHLSYQVDWRVSTAAASAGTHIVTGAIDFDGERATLRDRSAGTATNASRNNAGYSLQHQALWPRVFTTIGVRVEDNDSFGVSTVPRGSIAWIARTGSGSLGDTKVKASAGLGIKEPTIVQSFSPPPFAGNLDLEPERSRTVEAGVEQRFLNDRAKVEVTWFANRFRNIISTRTVSFNPFRSQYFNIGLTRARGAELAVDLAPSKDLRLSTGYTLLASEILESTAPTNPVFRPGQWLFRRPRHSGFTSVTYQRDRVLVDVSGIFVGRRVDSDFSSLVPAIVENDAYALWNLRAQYRLSTHISVVAAVDNLTGSDYMEPLGYRALGRTARLGVKVGF